MSWGEGAMSYKITPADNGKYITIKMVGDMTRDVANQHVLEAHALGAELGIRCYLVDVTESRNTESVLDNYKFAHADVRSIPGMDRRACVAVLVAPGDHSHDFYETLARNAGIDSTLFRDRDEAVAHLEAAAKRIPPLQKRNEG